MSTFYQVTLPRLFAMAAGKVAAALALCVAMVLIAGSWVPSSESSHVELQQRVARNRLGGRRAALMRKQRATQLWATQDNGVRSEQRSPVSVS